MTTPTTTAPTPSRIVPLLGQLDTAHALHALLIVGLTALWLTILQRIIPLPTTGKSSATTYFYAILLIAIGWMVLRSFLCLIAATRTQYPVDIPLWEQVLLIANELIAAGLFALFGANLLVRFFQPDVFTTRFDALYQIAVGIVIGAFYGGMQVMWTRSGNRWLSQHRVWMRLARAFAPLIFIVTVMIILRRFLERVDERSAALLTAPDVSLAILAVAPMLALIVVVLVIIIYSGDAGLRRRFMPDAVTRWLPAGLIRRLATISDMDILMILILFATLIPAYLVLGQDRGFLAEIESEIAQSGSALIETSEQALALLFAIPFYGLIVFLLGMYGWALSQSRMSIAEREALVRQLPVSFLILLIITLYLVAIPLTQVLTEGRLPQIPQDTGRILAFNIVIPLILLYGHYLIFIRIPYGRGQRLWRTGRLAYLASSLYRIDNLINGLNANLRMLNHNWRSNTGVNDNQRFTKLYEYIEVNSRRDDLNMERLELVAERQQLIESSDAPIALAVARLPVRIVSIGIPLLLIIQIYQWAVVNNGLRAIVDDPTLTIFEFFRAILQQTQF